MDGVYNRVIFNMFCCGLWVGGLRHYKSDMDCGLKTSAQRIFSRLLKMVTEGDVAGDVGSVCSHSTPIKKAYLVEQRRMGMESIGCPLKMFRSA